ncbi:DUF4401 domain-containing protein [Myxococcus llanfairpwllgwyngyllgogerychwyrndrobwllllantysiliogogogochensis]|uniref:DUF4401 domain-containing protein n=1 Tax=Myxococcus llanfairpwllgwyngyllgogerychwyrndrobwllllantysiliogogogochensis TaxID=2590453 RepID=A0A540WMK5_9BACT|nr:DUF4401 domain-containing protein [Myxococcus llanfairpwllgwyngyllgogerychwyrndrobwllllantysiliogogogochensis]TQF10246.1 DUF4401 domain-containing protein [Myxococcus llanfairpwllgwyngyllgogerychwyrndrobwllllantysiliogogogochensis]
MSLRPSLRHVIQELQREHQLDEHAEARALATLEVHQRSSTATPWFVKALAGFGAWVSAAFLLSFFGCTGLYKEQAALLCLGVLLCVGATFLRRSGQGAFLEQLALALALAGVGLTTSGIAFMARDEIIPAVAHFIVCAALLVTFPDPVMRFLATFNMAGAALFILWDALGGVGLDLGILACAALAHGLFLFQSRLSAGPRGALVGPAAFALASGLPLVLLARGLPDVIGTFLFERAALPIPALTVGLTTITLFTAWNVMRELELDPTGVAGAAVFAALTVTALITPHTPAVIAAVGLLTLGFHRRSSILLGIAVAFLIASGAWYYYDLGLTLLAKAIALAGSGLVLLALRWVLTRRYPTASTPAEAR